MCGRCKIRYLSPPPSPTERDKKFFSPEALADGWRLACAHAAPATDVDLELPDKNGAHVAEIKPLPHEDFFLAIDLGTTSIEWEAVDSNGETLATGKFFNPQAGAGSDVISRLEAVAGGDKRLADMVWDAFAEIIAALETGGGRVKRVCVAANSALSEILTGKDVSGLCAAPWRLSWRGGETAYFYLNGRETEFIFPPLFSPFVGGDVACGLLALKRAPRPFLFADLGTNAEIVLAAERSRVAGAPLGPALEGVGPALGRVAGEGVVSEFYLTPTGITPGLKREVPPKGVSAAGYISLLALLKRLEIMRENGTFNSEPPLPLAKKTAANFAEIKGERRLNLADHLFLTAGDVEIILKVKAAFSAVLTQILADMDARAIKKFYLAGAIGKHAKIEDLLELGFISRIFADKIIAVGNASLAGAKILARRPEELDWLMRERDKILVIDVAGEAEFFRSYLNSMRWRF